MARNIDKMLVGNDKQRYDELFAKYIEANVSEGLAQIVASEQAMFSALDISEAAKIYQFDLNEVAQLISL